MSFHVGLSSWVEEHMYLSNEKNLCQKQERVAHGFPLRIELVLERITSCKLGVSR
jgi:hypothetical protein